MRHKENGDRFIIAKKAPNGVWFWALGTKKLHKHQHSTYKDPVFFTKGGVE